jgi:hypothetical protein
MASDNPKRRGGPRRRESRPLDGVQQIFKLAEYQQSFDIEAFDHLIRSQGVKVIHYRALPDPSGMASLGDVHAVQSKRKSSDGFIYKPAGEMHIWFSSNSSDWNIEVEGMIKHDTAVVTTPHKYEDCPEKDVILAPYDRFYLKDVEVRVVAMQYVEANSTGVDKLQYPVVCVEHLEDADGKEYFEDKDFTITPEGFIKWITQNRPGFNEKTMRGTVYAIRYRYTPYFVIARLMHEIRLSQITDPATFDRKLTRMPFQALVIREHVLSDQNRDANSHILDQRFQLAPPVGGFTGPSDGGTDGGML